ncbi:hypothetical protein [Bremerella sp.]|uniref:immunity protein Imm33 domain-containing protein n=1 Tax=Bremerella sp. TaxID=2795602 RepID=UPI00391AC2D5
MRTVRQQVASTSISEFRFDTDESAPDFIVDAFTDWLSDYIANGAAFADGQTLQYGYTLLTCRVKSRVLRLLAPDFQSMPIKWIDDLGPAFGIVAAHKYTPETFGFTPDIPTLGNTAIIGNRFDEIPMFANRLSPVESNPNDSGWFIGSDRDDVDNNDPDQLQLMSLYEAMLAVPHVLDFLSLPVGCQVVFSGGNPVVLQDYEEMEIPKGSYLDRRFNAQ